MDKNKANVPKIRFPGFTDPWEQRKLGECFTERQERSSFGELISVTINYGIMRASDLGKIDNSSDDKSKYKKVEIGDIAYNSMRMWQGASGYSAYSGILSPAYTVIIPRKNVDALFFSFMFKKPEMIQTFQNRSQGMTSDTWNLKFPAFSKIKISIPEKQEQEKIGTFFRELDKLITLHQRKLKHLQDKKKSLLQKMFPKKGEDFPELRFPEFTDPWKQRKLSDVMKDFIVPMRDKPKSFGGNIPWTRIEDIEGKYLNGTLSNQFVSEKTIKEMNLKIIPKNSLIVSASATFGVVAVVTRDLITNQTFIGLVPNDGYDIDYLYVFFQTPEVRKYMKEKSAGSTIFYISKDDFKKLESSFPCLSEQTQIGNYFSEIDNLIALHQRKLKHLQEQKKALLQQMFV